MAVLKMGDQGPAVKQLQDLLIAKGYKIDSDTGYYGAETQAAVQQFEKDHGLTVDGEAGDQVMAILEPAVQTIAGADVSAYQPNVNWESAKNDIKFVYIKTSEGMHTIDTSCHGHANGAKAAGIKIGYYHFGTVTKDAAGEAQFFDSVIKTLPAADLPPVLDIETNSDGISAAAMEVWINTFLDTLKGLGHSQVMIYSGPAFLNENLPAGHNLGNYPLWLAQYTGASNPTIPHGWTHYTVWQYNDKGQVGGIGACDVNKAISGFLG